MNVLIACEESQRVCIEFRRKGHNAFSCDIMECSGGHPEWHILGDVLPLLNGRCSFTTMDGTKHRIDGKWDLIIAHPPCTHLANSGARHFARKRENGEQEKAIRFFAAILAAECVRIAVENPLGIISGKYLMEHFPELCREFGLPLKPSQIIQPWQFSICDEDNTEKTTGIWIRGDLPLLVPTQTSRPEIQYFTWTDKNGRKKRQTMWYYKTRCMPPEERAREASKTFPGIAKAMAEQWG